MWEGLASHASTFVMDDSSMRVGGQAFAGGLLSVSETSSLSLASSMLFRRLERRWGRVVTKCSRNRSSNSSDEV